MNGNFYDAVFAAGVILFLFASVPIILSFFAGLLGFDADRLAKKLGLDLGLFSDKSNPTTVVDGPPPLMPCIKGGFSESLNEREHKKIPAYAEHKQEFYGIYANGKFENPINDYNTEKRELQEV